ncbi:MAG TPA: hypothetical protein VFC39_01275 [Acidobacteriaceae bacterium]|nr:hypothetical protein [Acidobacteriaceae bacterium]
MRKLLFAATGAYAIERKIELTFSLAGAGCTLSTDSAALAENVLRSTVAWLAQTVCELNVDVLAGDESPLAAPHFRGMHHVVVASFGAANVFVFDLRRRIVTAKVSETVARDAEFWPRTLLPIMAGVLGATIDVLPLHSACLAREGFGMLIAGESGAGKSTLAVALAQRNFDYISDDWTYCTVSSGLLTAHGTAARVKLLPDAARYFGQLNEHQVHTSMNGELAFEVRVEQAFGVRLERQCMPRLLIFYHRTGVPASRFTPLDRAAARRYMEGSVERFPPQLAEASRARSVLMDAVAALPCWKFECRGNPARIAQELDTFFEARRREATA